MMRIKSEIFPDGPSFIPSAKPTVTPKPAVSAVPTTLKRNSS